MYYYQKSGKLLPFTDENWITENHYYRYGRLNKEAYYSEEIPKCNLCGSQLNIMKKGKSALILSCTNPDCKTNIDKHARDFKLIAFLPQEYYEKIKEKRSANKHSYYDINYLTEIKGLTEEEAKEYIAHHKKIASDKNSGHNREYFSKKYGEEEYNKKRKLGNRLCVDYWTNKGFTYEEAKNEISKIQSEISSKRTIRSGYNKEHIINKIGIENAESFFKERSHFCIEYWLKRGYTEEEGKAKISELQRKNCERVKNHISNKNVGYWIKNGLTEEEAKTKVSEIQRTFTKEKCIKKYGKIEGLKRWKERQDKWQTSLHKSENLHVGFSKISQELFKKIDKHLGDNDYTFYGSKNHEYCLREDGINYIYDFTDLEHKKMIEFQGDIYHGNPELFTEDEHLNPFKRDKSCKDLWEFDDVKSKIANKNNFKILHIWEKDYRENKNKIINKCLNFILND